MITLHPSVHTMIAELNSVTDVYDFLWRISGGDALAPRDDAETWRYTLVAISNYGDPEWEPYDHMDEEEMVIFGNIMEKLANEIEHEISVAIRFLEQSRLTVQRKQFMINYVEAPNLVHLNCIAGF